MAGSSCCWESPPIWEQWQEGGTERVEGETGSKASPLFFKELRSQNERKRISPPFTQGLQSFFENDVRKEKAELKGTRKKVRFLPRELNVSRASVNQQLMPLEGTRYHWVLEIGLLTLKQLFPGKKILHGKDMEKKTQWPSFPAFLIHTFTIFWNTATHLQNAIFPTKLFLISGRT